MTTITITDDQLAQLQGKIAKLTTDKGTADSKTKDSNDADAASAAAQAKAAQAKLDEQTADSAVSGDLTDLQSFIAGLAAGSPIPV